MVFTLLQIIAITAVTLPLSIGAAIAGQWRWTQPVFFGISRVWSRILLRIVRVHIVVRGAEHLQTGTSYLLAANHASMFDIIALLAAIPANVCFVMKRELTRVPIWGWGLIRSPYIVVDRTSLRDAKRGMAQAESRLREGDRSVVFFPEGTRTRDGKLQSFKRGAFAVAINAGAPVVPVTINGSFPLLPKGSFRIQQGRIEIVIHPPISSVGISDEELLQRTESSIRQSYIDQ